MWRLVYAIPSWILFQLFVFIPLVILGWVLIPLAAACAAYELTDMNYDKPDDGPIYHFTWGFMWLWDNFGDGIANRNYKKFDSLFWQIIYWSASRNPVNNLRRMPLLSCRIDPRAVAWRGSLGEGNWYVGAGNPKDYDDKVRKEYWLFIWCGPYSAFRRQYKSGDKLKEFWVGWKIWPNDINGVTEYRQKGAGFAFQWREF